jgi:transposase-like protein
MAAIECVQADSGLTIELRQSKFLNNIVEQDHRAIKRLTRPMLGFKPFWFAAISLAGIEMNVMDACLPAWEKVRDGSRRLGKAWGETPRPTALTCQGRR